MPSSATQTTALVQAGAARASVAVVSAQGGVVVQLPVAMIDCILIQASAVLDVRGLNFKVFDSTVVLDEVFITLAKVISDEVALADAVSLGSGKNFSDATDITDNFSRVVQFYRDFADAVGMTDSQAMTAAKALGDSVAVTDAYALSAGKVLADTTAITDAYALSFSKSLADATAISDAAAQSVGKLLADALAAVDAGSVRNQSYVDSTYLAEDYVGDSRTF